MERSRLLGSSDRESLVSPFLTISDELGSHYPAQLSKFISEQTYLMDVWHTDAIFGRPDEESVASTWRLKERMKTAGVALVICLNIGTDPPDCVKPYPCARRECWHDPLVHAKQKGLEIIGNALQQQYEKWQSKAKYKQCLDPTSDELKRICSNLRKQARSDRLLLHYNGHGVPRPTINGELWVFGKNYTHYMPVAIRELRSCLGDPAIFVLDCSGAGILIPHFIQSIDSGGGSQFDEGASIVLASCRANEMLPLNPLYPADMFTSCLTTPIPIALRWFILQNPYSMEDVSVDLAENIPGKDTDRKSPRGELNWIFTAITDTIAWNTLPSHTFLKMFRQDLLVASLFRNFLLAKRIMKSFHCTPQSLPSLPDSTLHPLWQSWDLAAEACLLHVNSLLKGAPMIDPRNNMSMSMSAASPPTNTSGLANSTFFTDHLTAFETWLDFETSSTDPPMHLPILLQVVLSPTHRLRALLLLRRYLALGPHAVNLSLIVGIFPYMLKLLQSPAQDIRQVLVCIWAAIIGFDLSSRNEPIRDRCHSYFIKYLDANDMLMTHRCMAAFTLAEICSGNQEGRSLCLQEGLHRSCSAITSLSLCQVGELQCNAMLPCGLSDLQKWACLCLHKLCEEFPQAKNVCLTEAGSGHLQLHHLLVDGDSRVRAAAVLALGELFGASSAGNGSTGVTSNHLHSATKGSAGTFVGGLSDKKKVVMEAELGLAIQLLESCTDGSSLVRREAIIALGKFIVQPFHSDCIKLIAMELQRRGLVRNGFCLTSSPTPAHVYTLTIAIRDHLEGLGFDAAFAHTQFSNPNPLFGSHISVPNRPPSASLTPPQSSSSLLEADDDFMNPSSHSISSPLFPSGMHTHNSSSPSRPHAYHISAMPGSVYSGVDEARPGGTNPSKSMTLASWYIRLWMALHEVASKDPHDRVNMSAVALLEKVSIEVEFQLEMERNPNVQGESNVRSSSDDWGLGSCGSHDNQDHASWQSLSISKAQSPTSPLRTPTASLYVSGNVAGLTSIPKHTKGLVKHSSVTTEDDDALTSTYYQWCRTLFLAPDGGFNATDDPLSSEGQEQMHRSIMLGELIEAHMHLSSLFKGIDEKYDPILDRKAREELQTTHSSMVAALPQSLTKFEQKAIINIENSASDATPLVIFHPFHELIAVANGNSVGIWSLSNCTKLVQIHNDLPIPFCRNSSLSSQLHRVKPRALSGQFIQSQNSSTSLPSTVSGAPSPPLPPPLPPGSRITAMTWINESSESLLMVGSADGSVKIWRDAADSVERTSNAELNLASAFMGLPDIADMSHGSGLLLSWIQPTGTLVVGGNSSSIRVWDLSREQCARVFSTGLDTCVTALASQTISPGLSLYSSLYNSSSSRGSVGQSSQPMEYPLSCMSWTFAGFADGSLAVFDERVGGSGGRVHISKEHTSWVISAFLRPDAPELVTASVRGALKFTDLRTMRPFKTLEVQKKSPVTAVATHLSAPLIALGSHAQFIKILTFGGEQLGSIIKYHDGFLGQRIGPVCSLAFHPTRMLLAAGATDNIVSIYGTSEG